MGVIVTGYFIGGGEEVPGKEEETEFPGNNVEIVTVDLPMARTVSSGGGGGVTELNTQEEGTWDLAFFPKSLLVRWF